MKKKIPAIIIIIFGIALMASVPAPGLVIAAIGVILLVRASKKPAHVSVPLKCELENFSEENAISVMRKDPRFDNPKKTDKPIYKYMYFEQECNLVQTGKTSLQVEIDGKTIGDVPAAQCGAYRNIMNRKAGAPVLTIYGGERKIFTGEEWIEDRTSFKGVLNVR